VNLEIDLLAGEYVVHVRLDRHLRDHVSVAYAGEVVYRDRFLIDCSHSG
jgi:hypothetical protein